jgi:hypothetical protein
VNTGWELEDAIVYEVGGALILRIDVHGVAEHSIESRRLRVWVCLFSLKHE